MIEEKKEIEYISKASIISSDFEEKSSKDEKNKTLDKDEMLNKQKSNVTTSSYSINTLMKKLNDIIDEKEKHRNYKLISEFDRERTNLENEQAKIRHQIEDLAKMNVNEKNINKIKEEKNKQQDLFNKYYKMNSETVSKINKFNENLPVLEEKIKLKQNKLKNLNHDNLLLLQKIQELKLKKIENYMKKESENKEKKEIEGKAILQKSTFNLEQSQSKINNNPNLNLAASLNSNLFNSSQLGGNKLNNSKFKYTEYGKEELNKSVLNITEVVDENKNLKEKHKLLKQKKAAYINFI